jgi:hypothetical protein
VESVKRSGMGANHPKHHPIALSASVSALTVTDAQPPSTQPHDFLTLSVVGIWGSNGTENRFKGLDSSNFGLELNFRPCSDPGRRSNHQNGAVGVRHVTSRNMFSLSESRIGMLLSRFSVPLLPKPPLYGERQTAWRSATASGPRTAASSPSS